jgi:hypothetical protein
MRIMKKQTIKIFTIVALLLTTSAISVFAQSTHLLKAHIPFSFIARDQSFPAGDYTIETIYLAGSEYLKLQSTDGHFTGVLPTRAMKISVNNHDVKLLFDKVSDQYVLAQVFGLEEQTANTVYLSKTESRLAKHTQEAKKQVLTISAHRQ